MYPSPQVDFGYDISDYESVDPQYGTLKDFDRLEAAAGRRGIRIILDMVLNHTSDQHRWFIESASSRNNPKADWYVWSPGIPANSPGVGAFQRKNEHDGVVPPNNWESFFGGSAWEWVPARLQFYYHKFYKQQPDLNWRNPAVEAAMFDMMKFWLRRGVAGFRLDAIPELYEDAQLRDEPELPGTNDQGDPNLEEVRTANQPEMHDLLRRLRSMVDQFPGNRVLIGETYPANIAYWMDGTEEPRMTSSTWQWTCWSGLATVHALLLLTFAARWTKRKPSYTARSRFSSLTITTMTVPSTASAMECTTSKLRRLSRLFFSRAGPPR